MDNQERITCENIDFTRFYEILSHHFSDRWTKHETLFSERMVIVTLLFMTSMGKSGYDVVIAAVTRELRKFVPWRHKTKAPSPSAFCQARKKISADKIRDVTTRLASQCTHAQENPLLTYKSFRLLSGDGTTLELPPCRTHRRNFPRTCKGIASHPDDRWVPKASMVLLHDIGAHMPVDYRLSESPCNERAQLLSMSDHLGPGDLLLLDRGFPSKEMFHTLSEKGCDFIIRMQGHQFNHVKAFIESGLCEDTVVIDAKDAKGRKKTWKSPCRIRLIRDDHLDENGAPRVFATSLLDCDEYKREDLLFLYSKRWKIETMFREMKKHGYLECLHAQTTEGVYQEIATLVLTQVLMSEIEGMVRQENKKRDAPRSTTYIKRADKDEDLQIEAPVYDALESPVVYNRVKVRLYAVTLAKNSLGRNPEEVYESLREALANIAQSYSKIRPGRTAPRDVLSNNSAKKKEMDVRQRDKANKRAKKDA